MTVNQLIANVLPWWSELEPLTFPEGFCWEALDLACTIPSCPQLTDKRHVWCMHAVLNAESVEKYMTTIITSLHYTQVESPEKWVSLKSILKNTPPELHWLPPFWSIYSNDQRVCISSWLLVNHLPSPRNNAESCVITKGNSDQGLRYYKWDSVKCLFLVVCGKTFMNYSRFIIERWRWV